MSTLSLMSGVQRLPKSPLSRRRQDNQNMKTTSLYSPPPPPVKRKAETNVKEQNTKHDRMKTKHKDPTDEDVFPTDEFFKPFSPEKGADIPQVQTSNVIDPEAKKKNLVPHRVLDFVLFDGNPPPFQNDARHVPAKDAVRKSDEANGVERKKLAKAMDDNRRRSGYNQEEMNYGNVWPVESPTDLLMDTSRGREEEEREIMDRVDRKHLVEKEAKQAKRVGPICCGRQLGPHKAELTSHLTIAHGLNEETAKELSSLMLAASKSKSLSRNCASIIAMLEREASSRQELESRAAQAEQKATSIEAFWTKECSDMKEKYQDSKKEISKLKEERRSFVCTTEDIRRMVIEKENMIDTMKSDLSAKETNLADQKHLSERYEQKLNEERIEHKKTIEIKDEELERKRKEISKLVSEFTRAKEELIKKNAEASRDCEKYKKAISEIEGRLKLAELSKTELKSVLDGKDSELKSIRSDLSKVANDVQEWKKKSEAYKTINFELERELRRKDDELKSALDFADKICDKQIAQISTWRAERKNFEEKTSTCLTSINQHKTESIGESRSHTFSNLMRSYANLESDSNQPRTRKDVIELESDDPVEVVGESKKETKFSNLFSNSSTSVVHILKKYNLSN